MGGGGGKLEKHSRGATVEEETTEERDQGIMEEEMTAKFSKDML